MPRLALLARERFVGHLAQEVLEKAVLPALGRAGIGLEREHLFPHECRQHAIELGVAGARDDRERGLAERLAEHGRVLEHAALLRRQAVEAGGDQRLERLRHFERLDRARGAVLVSHLLQQTPVDEHAHRLDCVEGNTFRALEDLRAKVIGRPGTKPSSSAPIASAERGSSESVVAFLSPAAHCALSSADPGRASATTRIA